jgi:2-keto-4-pentenoate hydratase
MEDNRIQLLSKQLMEAEKKGNGMEPLTKTYPALSEKEAYQIQLINIQKKLDAGEKIVGKKIGLTSAAMQSLLGVNEPDYGHLLDGMILENHGNLSWQKVCQPKVEAEIAFVLKQDLVGPNVSELDVLLATDYVVPALEIVDSRIRDWNIQLVDTVADNASSGFFVLGSSSAPIENLDFTTIGMALYKNGELMNTGAGAAALGHPAKCVAWLANKLHDYGIQLKAGEVILSGALSAAVAAEPGDYFHAKLAHLGEVSMKFGD